MSSLPPQQPATPQKTAAPKTSTAPVAPATKAPARRKKGGSGFVVFLIIGAVLFGAAVYFFGVLPREAASSELTKEQKISVQRIVIYALAHRATPKTVLPLPGTIEAFQQASIFAQTTGYVKRWTADIGDIVHQGDVLAELDTPEVDQQLSQAKATVQQAQASLAIANTAAQRWNTLVTQHAVSQEEADEKNATSNVAKATLSAAQADVARLSDLENFKQIRAPFTGTITFRHIEIGNLITSGTGSQSGTNATSGGSGSNNEIYRLAQTDPLRVYVDVPEGNSRSIHPGVEADLHVSTYSDRVFKGEVVRSAGALDTASRTLRTEIRVPNPDGALLPGTYAEVRLQLDNDTPAVLIPANTLIVNASGTSVARVDHLDGEDKIHLLPVKVGRDFGTEVEILQDVQDGDRLVTNPPSDIAEGMVVTAQKLPDPPPASPPPGVSPAAQPPKA